MDTMILTSLTTRSTCHPAPGHDSSPDGAVGHGKARSRATLSAAAWRTLLLASTLALGACTNSKLVIGPLYNRLDDRMRDEFEKLGEFDGTQTALFEAALGTGHVWHRQSELPRYARVLDDIAASIARPGETTPANVTRWAQEIEARSVAARECHPVNFSFPLMKSLTDEQVDFIERRFASERAENREKYLERTAEERREYRQKNIEKWAGRIGLDFTAEQRAMLRTALTRQVSLRQEYWALSDAWKKELFRLAREQDAPDYETRMGAHLDELWTMLETAHPDEWRRNRELWRDFAIRFVGSMTPAQRAAGSAWLAKMAETLEAISRDEPSFVPGDDPTIGCLVETALPDGTAPEGEVSEARPAG